MKLFWFFLLFLSSSAFSAQPFIQLRTEANPREITIGDRISYQITLVYSNDVTALPLAFPTPFGEFDLLVTLPSQPKPSASNSKTLVYDFILTTFSTGSVVIPSLTLRFTTQDKKEATAQTEAITIQIKSLLEEKGDLGNIMPAKGMFDFRSTLWIWILLGLLIVSLLVYFLIQNRKKQKESTRLLSKPRRPAQVEAWEALQILENSELIAKGQIKEFYYQISLITRQYLEDRFSISALDRTTSELLIYFRDIKMSSTLINLARGFFDNADLVKFAKFTPSEEDIDQDLERVKQFINLTVPQIEKEIDTKVPV